jgi:hypothetical protein
MKLSTSQQRDCLCWTAETPEDREALALILGSEVYLKEFQAHMQLVLDELWNQQRGVNPRTGEIER